MSTPFLTLNDVVNSTGSSSEKDQAMSQLTPVRNARHSQDIRSNVKIIESSFSHPLLPFPQPVCLPIISLPSYAIVHGPRSQNVS